MTTRTTTDTNTAHLNGRLAVDAEVKTFDSGVRLIRYLVSTTSTSPQRRVDVIPAVLWHPTDEQATDPGRKGDRIDITGSLQRRFWEGADGRRSRIEFVAHEAAITPAAGGGGDDIV